MAEDRGFLEKLLKPTEEEKEDVKKKLEKAFETQRGIEKYGYGEFLEKIVEDQKVREGKSPEEIIETKDKTTEYVRGLSQSEAAELIQGADLKGTRKPEKILPEIKVGEEVIQAGTLPTPKVGLEEDELSEIGTAESVGNAILSGGIKIPQGFVTLGTLLYDAFQDSDIPVDKTLTAKINAAFDRSMVGVLAKESEEKARATATGRISEFIVQLYGAGKFAGKPAAAAMTKINQKARKIADQVLTAMRKNRYVNTTSKNVYNAAKKTKELNKITGWDKFVGITVGGGIGTGAVIMKAEDIGTFGDINVWPLKHFPTRMDREGSPIGAEDAQRQLLNRFKLGTELGFPIIPFFYGTGKVMKMGMERGRKLAFSDLEIERWVDRWLLQPFRSRSYKHQAIFEGGAKLEGRKAGIKLLADDFAKNVDDNLKRISVSSKGAAQAVDPDTISRMLSRFMLSTKDSVKKGKIYFEGFPKKSIDNFRNSMKKVGVSSKNVNSMVEDAVNFRMKVAELKHAILAGKNIIPGSSKFNDIMTERVNNFLSLDYKIFDQNKGFVSHFKPTDEVRQEVAKVFQRYAKNNKAPLSMDKAMGQVDDVISNVQINPLTRTPEFIYANKSVLSDRATQVKNISENITGAGKFKADADGGLIQKESDMTAFRKLFGEYRDAKKVIFNVMNDLGSILSRDQFYNRLLKESAASIRKGEPGIFFNTYDEALMALPGYGRPGKAIIKNPLKLKTRLGEEVYTSPLDDKFTTKDWAEAIRLGDEIVQSDIAKNFIYRNLFLIPKGLAQMSKTVLGVFTHSRNFFSAGATAIHRGNVFIPPMKMLEFMNTARKTVQPQMMYKLTGNPSWRNTKESQALYKFLLDEGVTNQSATYRDVMGLWEDIGKGGDVWTRLWNSAGKRFKQSIKVAQDLYVAEDDAFRIFNFLAEGHKIKSAYQSAIKGGMKVKMPDDLAVMKEAAEIVRATVPNYARVSDFIRGVRRSPLGNFVSFGAEILRTVAGATNRALYEIKHPVLSVNGYKGLVGQATTYALIPAVVYETMRGLYGISREKVRAIREVLPEWSKDSTILPIYEDGKYKYVDFSHGFFYDTAVNPVQSVLAEVDKRGDEPLMPALITGLNRAMARLVDPFISESIWFGTVADLFIRDGVTKDNKRIWNPEDTWENKFWEAMKHAAYVNSPGSYPSLKRLYKSALGETVKGTRYEIPDELMGFFGFRQVPLDLNKTLNFKIQEFNREERGERNLIYKGTLTGDPVKDEDLIVKQFIKANEQRLEAFNKMRRIYDSVKVLGMRDKEIAKEFGERGAGGLYTFIRKNRFKPFTISKNMAYVYAQLAKEKGIPNVLTKKVQKRINKIIKRLYKQRLNQPYNIDVKDYIKEKEPLWKRAIGIEGWGDQSKAPPGTPMPKVAVAPQINQQTGLTPTEAALLSPSEQQIARRT